ncbi:MAG: glycosyltransferase [Rhodobacteraceae bacterium]|nr:glycosyltransferase [Paracoccaceae bacterium]
MSTDETPGTLRGTVAIATGILGTATETGVRRHIALLFSGRTVVLCERRDPDHVSEKPVFVAIGGRSGPLQVAEREIGKAIQSLRYKCSGVPFGRVRRELQDFLRTHDVQAIVAEFGHLGGNLAPLGNALGIPVFVYFRGFDASKRLRSPRIIRRYRAAIPRLAGVVSVSQSLLDNLAAVGVRHPNSVVIPTGVDTSVFVPLEKDPHLILAVGRIVEKKAPLITIDAFAAAAADFPEHRLEIVGAGELRATAEAHVRALGLEARVIFHGRKDHAFVREKIGRAQVFIQHSVTAADGNTEGLPTSIQEAMSCGAVVVSTRHAGIPEAITDGETGLLVDEHDAGGFALALRRVLQDPGGAARMGRAARAAAEDRFEFRKLHARLEAMIRAALPPA